MAGLALLCLGSTLLPIQIAGYEAGIVVRVPDFPPGGERDTRQYLVSSERIQTAVGQLYAGSEARANAQIIAATEEAIFVEPAASHYGPLAWNVRTVSADSDSGTELLSAMFSENSGPAESPKIEVIEPAAVLHVYRRHSPLLLTFLTVGAIAAGCALARQIRRIRTGHLLYSSEQLAAWLPVVGVLGAGPAEIADPDSRRRSTLRVLTAASEVALAGVALVLALPALLESSLVARWSQFPTGAVAESLRWIFSS